MMDLAHNSSYAIEIGIALIVLLILALVIVIRLENQKQHQQIADKIAKLPPSPEGTERIIEVVEEQQEMTRQHVSNTLGSVAHETEMNKGLLRRLLELYHNLVAVLTDLVTPPKEPK